jgi:radical SAM protein with 4Fe4S-binding SPASM domain
VDVATNGVVLYDHIRRGLSDLPVFQVQVSIDGIGERHDRFRGRPGAFEAACRTLRELRRDGMAVSINTTATAENLHEIERIVDLALELGCVAYKAIPFIPAGRGRENDERLRLGREQLAELGRTLSRLREQHAGRLSIATDSGFAFLFGAAPAAAADGPMGCSAGHDTLSVGADGTAYPCPFLQGFPLGNLLDVPLRELWRAAPALGALRGLSKSDFAEPCRSCSYAPELCHGGCRAAAWLTHGSLLARDPGCFREVADGSSGLYPAHRLLEHPAR